MNCYYCKKYFSKKALAMDHLEREHGDSLVDDGITAAQACYLTTHPDIHGRCVVCHKPTEWSDKLGKPHRICGNPACKAKLADEYNRNRDNALHMTQSELMSNMDHQRDMLNSRRIHGVHKFKDGGTIDYIGQLEKNFLWFLDNVMDMRSNDILPSPETFEYYDARDGVKRQYVPDYYLIDYNLLVEIKDGGDKTNGNPAFLESTRYKVAMKDEAMRKQTKYNYIRIGGTNYGPFMETLYNITHPDKENEKKSPKNIVIISESAELDKVPQDSPEATRLIISVSYSADSNEPSSIAATMDDDMSEWSVSDMESGTVRKVIWGDPAVSGSNVAMYRYIGDKNSIDPVIREIRNSMYGDDNDEWNIAAILRRHKIYFSDGRGFSNNDGVPRSDFIPMASDTEGGESQ